MQEEARVQGGPMHGRIEAGQGGQPPPKKGEAILPEFPSTASLSLVFSLYCDSLRLLACTGTNFLVTMPVF